jgi:hypothetical protein
MRSLSYRGEAELILNIANEALRSLPVAVVVLAGASWRSAAFAAA